MTPWDKLPTLSVPSERKQLISSKAILYDSLDVCSCWNYTTFSAHFLADIYHSVRRKYLTLNLAVCALQCISLGSVCAEVHAVCSWERCTPRHLNTHRYQEERKKTNYCVVEAGIELLVVLHAESLITNVNFCQCQYVS